MFYMNKNLDILYKIIDKYNFGKLNEDISEVKGGLCHLNYKLVTDNGTFMIKFVGDISNKKFWDEQDLLEDKLIENKIPGIYALKFNGSKVQCIDDTLFYIYPWYNGVSIRGENATISQTKKMAKYSAMINNIETKKKEDNYKSIDIDWDKYIEYSLDKNDYIYTILKENKDILIELMDEGNKRLSRMDKIVSLSHCDMDYKNVMWHDNEFKLIDMDSLGYANPYMLLFKNALVWSGYEEGNISYNKFKIFINTYFEYSKLDNNMNLEDYYYATLIGLEWLEVNLKRALGLFGDDSDLINLGKEQVKITMMQIINYYHCKDKIITCFNK